jgi:hypothetical protein
MLNAICALRASACLFLAFGLVVATCAQDDIGELNVHPGIAGQFYRDDKISVRAPPSWSVAILREEDASSSRGAIFRKGRYILRLCTTCGQVSGVTGGRFTEIARYVQPWYRQYGPDWWCGKDQNSHVSNRLDRVDFWFTRDPAHVFNEDANDCREPKTTNTVWYGSYFTERCSQAELAANAMCGGFLLHREWLTRKPAGIEEMVFALTYEADEQNLDILPRRNDPELKRTLDEAAVLVRSVHYKAPKVLPAQVSPQ